MAYYANLKLAARALIEWRTPRSAPEYTSVFTAITSIHPLLASKSRDSEQKLLSIDDHGFILEFLAETLVEKTQAAFSDGDTKRAIQRETATKTIHSVLFELMMSSHLGASDERLWTAGPLKSQLIGQMWRELDTYGVEVQRGLVALALPPGEALRRRWSEPLIRRQHTDWTILSILSRRLNFIVVSIARIAVALLFAAVLFMGFVVKGAMVDDNPRRVLMLALPSLVSLGCAGLCAIVASLLQEEWLLRLFSKQLRTERALRQNFVNKGRMVAWLRGCLQEFEGMYASDRDLLYELLKVHPQNVWTVIALAGREPLTSTVTTRLARLLQSPEVSGDLKMELLIRLMK